MTTLTIRHYTGEADLPAIVDLLNACDAVDQLDEGTSIDELRVEMADPSLDAGRNVRLWEGADGRLVAYAEIWLPPPSEEAGSFVWFKVHPLARGGLLESEILGWAQARVAQLARELRQPVRLRSGSRDDDLQRLALLEQHGFTISRYFLRLARPLAEPLPPPVLPEGFTLRPVVAESEAEAWVDLYNESFVDHWNHHPLTVERFHHRRSGPSYAPDGDLIAVAPGGTFAAFCHCRIDADENARTGRNEGWIAVLGTRRGYRRIGLGRALVLAGLHWLREAGVATAVLNVDASNPTGATRLYESAGFQTRHTFVAYSKVVEP